MEGSTGKQKTKKFTCPKCGTNHIVDSELNIHHSYYTEDQKKSEEVEKSRGVQNSETTDGKSDSGESESKATQEEKKKTEFEKEVSESEDEDTENDWGWDNW